MRSNRARKSTVAYQPINFDDSTEREDLGASNHNSASGANVEDVQMAPEQHQESDDVQPSIQPTATTARDRKRAKQLADAQRKKAKRDAETAEESERRLTSNAGRTAQLRSSESRRQTDRRKRETASRNSEVRDKMTQEEKEAARELHSSQVAEGRALLSDDERNEIRRKDAEDTARSRYDESENEREIRRRRDAFRAHLKRSSESDTKREERRQKNAARNAIRKSEEPEAEKEKRKATDAKRATKRRSEEPEEVQTKRRQQNSARTAYARASETPEQRSTRKAADRTRRVTRSNAQLGIAGSGASVDAHYIGRMDNQCADCGALFFKEEKTSAGKYTKCCIQGSVNLELFETFPQELKDLLTSDDADSVHFRKYIRHYNNAVAMGSMTAKMDMPIDGPYCFRLHGQVYHFVGPLHPNEGHQRKFAQIFMLDTAMAAEELAGRKANEHCSEAMFRAIFDIMDQYNPFVKSFKTMREVEKEEQQQAILENRAERSVSMTFRVNSEDDQRRYQLPTATEVAVVFVGDDDEIPGERAITVHQRSGQLTTLRDIDPQSDPLIYPVLFPTGKYGWHPSVDYAKPRLKRSRVSLREFYSFYLHTRPSFSPLFRSGKLFQQFVVDMWTRIEQSKLFYIRMNQDQLRVDTYKNLQDYVAGDGHGPVGSRVVLPASHTGSPRNMVAQYQDAMAIVSRYGKPDYFLTVTCNPHWREIQECLHDGQTASDRPDIVARVFNMKLKSICDDIYKKKVFGEPAAHIHVVEFQKRGLPHAHMLIIMKPGSKPRTAADVDKVISAELPDKDKDPRLWELVSKHMMHRACGIHNPKSTCTDKDMKCTKNFPKAFRDETSIDDDGFPLYRRRDDGRTTWDKKGKIDLDNRHVVPYNRWLLLKYECHVNMEVCSTVGSVKYIYKYVYKGNTRASIRIHTDANGVVHEIHDEIDMFLNTRYVCAPEAMHHIFGFKMTDRNVAVEHLSIHLPGEQQLFHRRGEEKEAVENAQTRMTTLTAFFEINQKCADAVLPDGTLPPTVLDSRNFVYHQMPEHFTFHSKEGWKPRKMNRSTIGRMYFPSPHDRERFALRLLLLYTKGPTSFEDLRTVGGKVYDTYVEAATKSGYLEDDTFYESSLEEAAGFQSATQFRGFFATLLCFGQMNNAEQLWLKFLDYLCEDYKRQGHSRTHAESMAFYDIFDRLEAMKVDLRSWIKLPYQRVQPPGQDVDYERCELEGDEMREKLTTEQETVVALTLDALEGAGGLFFIDGPGGSGKTYVYNCLANIVQGKHLKILCIAWTGIAASLLPHGRTVASVFRLNINDGCRSSTLKLGSVEAGRLAEIDLILWDEAPMSPKAALETVDTFFRDLMEVDLPFGGKVVVLGGDFRQVLPVMDKGGVDEQLANSIKRSDLWNHFRTVRLTSNMRLTGAQSTWRSELLSIGDGLQGAPITGELEVPEELKSTDDLAQEIFGDVLDNATSVEELSKRAILTPRNKEALEMNNFILRMMPGEMRTYKSLDEVNAKEGGDATHFPTEFLNQQTPSGMPPHELHLKKGAIIMLLRNLDVKNSLCNGTRFVVEDLGLKVLQCKFVSGARQGESVLLPRIRLNYEQNLPFVLSRLQFPVRLSFAMTINKSQGQTFDRIGLQLEEPVFSHGQLYVALSRTRTKEGIKIDSPSGKMNNVVFKDVL